jgi:hypothetical protein
LLLILSSNSLGSQKSSFFSRVPVELYGSLGLEAVVDKRSESLKDSDCATAIILGVTKIGGLEISVTSGAT